MRMAGLGILLIGMTAVVGCKPQAEGAEPTGRPQYLSVVPFQTQAGDHQALSAALAESLATRLTRLPGLRAAVNGIGLGSRPVFRVGGDLAVRDGRLVIAARLYEDGQTEPLWSATYWRKDSLDTALVSDLAQGLAEAVFGQLARRPTSAR